MEPASHIQIMGKFSRQNISMTKFLSIDEFGTFMEQKGFWCG